MLLMGENRQGEAKMAVDDWRVNEKEILLFCAEATGNREGGVCDLVGHWETPDGRLWRRYPPETKTLTWSQDSLSWGFRSVAGAQQGASLFAATGIDISRPHSMHLDVPFGHVLSFTAEVSDVLDSKLSRFFRTKFAPLGRRGQALSATMCFSV